MNYTQDNVQNLASVTARYNPTHIWRSTMHIIIIIIIITNYSADQYMYKALVLIS